ncbi:hypothetical protein DIPPA_30950 [Diplonema papillatum]|nr:hypothetical protein DIPPA_30950 [Diplonema papillatum]
MPPGNKRRKVDVPEVPEGVGGDRFGDPVRVPQRLLSRLLYANPVCLLCSRKGGEDPSPRVEGGDGAHHNLMTISWLTCIDNRGLFFASMHEGRSTASFLFGQPEAADPYVNKRFTLSVPVAGAEALLRRIGSERGDAVDKVPALGLRLCPPGWGAAALLAAGDAKRNRPPLARAACPGKAPAAASGAAVGAAAWTAGGGGTAVISAKEPGNVSPTTSPGEGLSRSGNDPSTAGSKKSECSPVMGVSAVGVAGHTTGGDGAATTLPKEPGNASPTTHPGEGLLRSNNDPSAAGSKKPESSPMAAGLPAGFLAVGVTAQTAGADRAAATSTKEPGIVSPTTPSGDGLLRSNNDPSAAGSKKPESSPVAAGSPAGFADGTSFAATGAQSPAEAPLAGSPRCAGEVPAVDHPLVVAHLSCSVVAGARQAGHHLLTCQILDGYVRRKYWSGDTLKPTEPDLPPFLTFFGSGQFGHAVPAEFKSSAP